MNMQLPAAALAQAHDLPEIADATAVHRLLLELAVLVIEASDGAALA